VVGDAVGDVVADAAGDAEGAADGADGADGASVRWQPVSAVNIKTMTIDRRRTVCLIQTTSDTVRIAKDCQIGKLCG